MIQRMKILLSCLALGAPTTQLLATTTPPAPGLVGLAQTAAKLAATRQYNQHSHNGQNPGPNTSSNFGPPPPVASSFGPYNTAPSQGPDNPSSDSSDQ